MEYSIAHSIPSSNDEASLISYPWNQEGTQYQGDDSLFPDVISTETQDTSSSDSIPSTSDRYSIPPIIEFPGSPIESIEGFRAGSRLVCVHHYQTLDDFLSTNRVTTYRVEENDSLNRMTIKPVEMLAVNAERVNESIHRMTSVAIASHKEKSKPVGNINSYHAKFDENAKTISDISKTIAFYAKFDENAKTISDISKTIAFYGAAETIKHNVLVPSIRSAFSRP